MKSRFNLNLSMINFAGSYPSTASSQVIPLSSSRFLLRHSDMRSPSGSSRARRFPKPHQTPGNIPNVKEAYCVYGAYDMVARIEAETIDKLKEVVTWKVRRLEKVRSTLTTTAMEST